MCPVGHELGARRVLLGWRACGCAGARHGGHRTWTCVSCLDSGVANKQATVVVGCAGEDAELRPDQRVGVDLSHLSARGLSAGQGEGIGW